MDKIEDFKKEKLTIDLLKANLYAIFAIIPILIIYGLPFYFLWRNTFSKIALKSFINEFSFGILGDFISILLVITVGTVLHELIHGITWAKYTENGFKSIRFGIMWRMLTPYCHCVEPLKVKHYILGAIMPTIILGFLPFVFSLVTGNLLWLFFGVFFTMGGVGDFLIINLLRKEKKDDLVLDHPTEAGCYIFRKKN